MCYMLVLVVLVLLLFLLLSSLLLALVLLLTRLEYDYTCVPPIASNVRAPCTSSVALYVSSQCV